MNVESVVTEAASLLAKAEVEQMLVIAVKGKSIYRISSFVDDEEVDRFFHYVMANARLTGAIDSATVFEATSDGLKKIQEKSDAN